MTIGFFGARQRDARNSRSRRRPPLDEDNADGNDGTSMKIMRQDPEANRKGIFTRRIISVHDEHRIALFRRGQVYQLVGGKALPVSEGPLGVQEEPFEWCY